MHFLMFPPLPMQRRIFERYTAMGENFCQSNKRWNLGSFRPKAPSPLCPDTAPRQKPAGHPSLARV